MRRSPHSVQRREHAMVVGINVKALEIHLGIPVCTYYFYANDILRLAEILWFAQHRFLSDCNWEHSWTLLFTRRLRESLLALGNFVVRWRRWSNLSESDRPSSATGRPERRERDVIEISRLIELIVIKARRIAYKYQAPNPPFSHQTCLTENTLARVSSTTTRRFPSPSTAKSN
jgi:hypothetical protein